MEDDLQDVFFQNDPEFAIHVDYTHKGKPSFDLMAIFDEEYTAVDLDTGAQYQSKNPMLTCQTSKFKFKPTRGDKVKVNGVGYLVVTSEPDGTGVSELTLKHDLTV